MIEPITIRIKDFKTIRDTTFRFDLPAGVHLITGDNQVNPRLGSNGSGKSSVLDALCWCLYGKTPDGRRGPDLIPWNSDASPTVSVEIQKGHWVHRTAKPNTLKWNKKDVDQKIIDDRVGMNFETFCHTVLLAQSAPLFFDLTPTEKMQLFNDVLHLEQWGVRSKKARKETAEIQTKIDTTEGWIKSTEAQIEDLKQELVRTKKRADNWSNEAKTAREEARFVLEELEKKITKVQREHDDADLAYDRAGTEITPLQKQLNLLHASYRNARGLRDAEKLKKEIATADKGKCPVCSGPLKDDKHVKALKQELADHEKAEASQAKLKKQCETLEKELEAFIKVQRTARDKLDWTTPQLATFKAQQTEKQKVLAQEEINPHREPLQSLRRRIGKLEADLEAEVKSQNIRYRKLARTEYWIKGFKDLELYLIESVLRELELANALMLDQMGLVGWKVHYATESENKSGTVKRGLSVFIQSPYNKDPVRWECWSGGEKQRLRILGALALSSVLLARADVDPSIEILDEPSSHLSTEGVASLVRFLSDRAKMLDRTIFFVDHTTRESSLFKSTVAVVRSSKNGTQVVPG
jgi:DNA repair exonuclease SbcCD ATPase subunit